ncbi:pyridoxamine 5'-phosphate oxidase family protein [Streptomyces specialis]|uniref:pyridoxamine 5'-phosphate oxidase family protein n=1 Tax=Streptomyces specialis TaxID=498367 RepID=UPI00073F4E24|nr:pyridoxamine 5'-phosphate oxidase family protein [Streptomyces specialis]
MTTEKTSPRDGALRRRDVLRRLTEDEDLWVSTASRDGVPCLVPLSFVWHGGALLVSTRASNPTAVNAWATGKAVVSLGHTRDVVVIEADAEVVPPDAVTEAEGEAFVGKLRFDTRSRPAWTFIRFRPRTVRAWREEDELAGRHLMADGVWLV